MPARQISDDLRWAVVHLSALGHSSSYVAMATGMSEHSVQTITKLFQETGMIGESSEAPKLRRPRILGNHEMTVS